MTLKKKKMFKSYYKHKKKSWWFLDCLSGLNKYISLPCIQLWGVDIILCISAANLAFYLCRCKTCMKIKLKAFVLSKKKKKKTTKKKKLVEMISA